MEYNLEHLDRCIRFKKFEDEELVHWLNNPNVDHSVGDNFAFNRACSVGCADIVRKLLSYPSTKIYKDNCDWHHAYYNGYVDVVKILISHHLIDSWAIDSCFTYGFVEILELIFSNKYSLGYDLCKNWDLFRKADNNTDVIKLLFKYNMGDPSDDNNYAIEHACYRKNVEVLRLLLNDNRVDPNAHNLCRIAYENTRCSFSEHEILKVLLDFEKVDPTMDSNWLFKEACDRGDSSLVCKLLKDHRIDPSSDNNRAIQVACNRGNLRIVRELLKDTRVDPRTSFFYVRHYEIMQELLKDPRIDPSINDNAAIIKFAGDGYIDMVDVLLKDPRVDPSAQKNQAIINAAIQKRYFMVNRLLKDPRVDPSAQNNKALRETTSTSVMAYLIADSRVDISVNDEAMKMFEQKKKHIEEQKQENERKRKNAEYLRKTNDSYTPKTCKTSLKEISPTIPCEDDEDSIPDKILREAFQCTVSCKPPSKDILYYNTYEHFGYKDFLDAPNEFLSNVVNKDIEYLKKIWNNLYVCPRVMYIWKYPNNSTEYHFLLTGVRNK